MSGNPSTSTSGSKGKDKEPQEPPRLFYSKNTAEEFSRQLNDIFDSTRQQHTEVKEAIESGFTTLNGSIAALTAAILGRERSPTPAVIPDENVRRKYLLFLLRIESYLSVGLNTQINHMY